MSSNQRPDTLMQDRISQVDETSCNARPDHTLGSISADMVTPSNHLHVRFAPNRYRDVAARRTVERW
jgi:hypothetical protein